MKSLIITAAAAAIAIPAPAFAVHTFLGMEFDSRGECESFLKMARNGERRNMDSASDFNNRVRDGFFCEDNGDGTFTISRTAA